MRWVRCAISHCIRQQNDRFRASASLCLVRIHLYALLDRLCAWSELDDGQACRFFRRLLVPINGVVRCCACRFHAAQTHGGALLQDTGGQATVEAAVLLPTLMLLFALLLQPVCLSYTRAIMRGAAGECARAAATAYGGDISSCESYALRRLKAVPEVPLFHVGGQSDWNVQINRSDSHVDVSIVGHARPLPLMGAVAALMSESDGTGVVLRVSLSEDTRASWVGGDYGTWQKIWG